MRKQTKIAALVSAAALLAIGASMTSFAEWKYNSDIEAWQYLDKYDQPVYGEWHRGDAPESAMNWYYVGYDGVMVTNSVVIGDNGDLYYVDENGIRVTNRWMEINAENGEAVEEGWYYFNKSNGKAVRANSKLDSNPEYQLISVPKTSGGDDSTKAGFVFDTNGRMQTGWVRKTYVSPTKLNQTFYCVQPGDEYEIELENPWSDYGYVEGQVLTGWAKIFVPEDSYLSTSYIDDFGYGWYYFNGGAMLSFEEGTSAQAKGVLLSWKGVKKYYTFDSCGIMKQSLAPVIGTNNNGTPSSATGAVPFDADKAYTSGNGWVYDFDNSCWYYGVNIKDSQGNMIARGVKFNSDGETVTVNGVTKSLVRVKSINGQLYAFNNAGTMITGDVYIDQEMIAACLSDKANDDIYYWYGIPYKTVPEAGWYYFNETANAQASNAGRMMRNTRVTTTDDDGDPHTRYYAANGAAAMDEAYNNYLYDSNGDLYLPEDGENYRRISVDDAENGQFVIHTGSRAGDVTIVKGTVEFKTNGVVTDSTHPAEVLINRSGALIKSGVINIDSETQLTVSNYVIIEMKTR